MPTGEGEGQTAYVDALAAHWPGFVHESRGVGYTGRGGMKVAWARAAGRALQLTDGGRGRILSRFGKCQFGHKGVTRPRL